MAFGFWCDSAFAFSMYQRKPPEELHLGERLQGGFLPPTGRIPPDSGGWHRGVLSRSVADAIHPRSLDTRTGYDVNGDFSKGTKVPEILSAEWVRLERTCWEKELTRRLKYCAC
jgi:hypothetical protein